MSNSKKDKKRRQEEMQTFMSYFWLLLLVFTGGMMVKSDFNPFGDQLQSFLIMGLVALLWGKE